MKSLVSKFVALIVFGIVIYAGMTCFTFDVNTHPIDSCVMLYTPTCLGSGVIVDVNCVLTARHVAIKPDLRIRTNDGDDYRAVKTAIDPDTDLALVYIDRVFDERPLRFDNRPLKVGENIVLIATPADKALINSTLHGRVVKTDVNPPVPPDSGWQSVDIIDAHSCPGCSGGPVLDKRGNIRAILVGGIRNLYVVIPVDQLNID